MTTQAIIQVGQTLTARSICDSDCVFSVTVLARKGNFVTVKVMGNEKRVKINKEDDGSEYIYAHGKFSMCPIFRAPRLPVNVIVAFFSKAA